MSVKLSEYSAYASNLVQSKVTKSSAKLAALVFLALPLAGCSGIDALNPFSGEKYEQKLLTDTPAETLYNQGLAKVNAGDAPSAVKKFKEIEKQYPYSTWTAKGQLMTAYAEYMGHNYDDAVTAGKRFLTLYPKSNDAPYALYILSEAEYERIPDISRDQETTSKALAGFNEIIQKYPKSEYAADSKFKIQVARDQLAGKEMSVGRFYLARKNYAAAINRFRNVIGEYQTTRHTEEALERLTEAYMGLGIVNEAQTAASILGHNFPDGQWYKDAYKLLQTSGTEPREDTSSWISQAFKKVGL